MLPVCVPGAVERGAVGAALDVVHAGGRGGIGRVGFAWDDLPAAVQALRADPAVFRSNELSSLANALEGICKSYLAFKEGIATTINMSYSAPGDAYPLVTRLRADLLLRVLPRILEVQENNRRAQAVYAAAGFARDVHVLEAGGALYLSKPL